MPSVPKQFYYKNNRLQQLRGFCYAAQFGNISRAAQRMGLNHSSVSVQVKALEDDLGVALFKRNGPRISLTREGIKLLNLALPLVDGIQQLHETFHQELQQSKKTELHMCANSTTLNFILPSLIERYLQEYPNTYITIHYAEHQEAMEKLRRDEIDFAMLPRRQHMPFPKDFEYVPVFHYLPALITRPDHPLAGRQNLSVEEISRYEITLPAEELRVIPNLYDIFPQHGIQKKLRINFANLETGRRYIESGLVITISSTVFLQKNDTLVGTPLLHLFPMADYGFVMKRRQSMPPKIEEFIDMARQQQAARPVVATA